MWSLERTDPVEVPFRRVGQRPGQVGDAGRRVDGQTRLEGDDHIGLVQELIGDPGWHLVRAVDAELGQGGQHDVADRCVGRGAGRQHVHPSAGPVGRQPGGQL